MIYKFNQHTLRLNLKLIAFPASLSALRSLVYRFMSLFLLLLCTLLSVLYYSRLEARSEMMSGLKSR